jgi:lauroyl/myristoyl acyltransferase
MKWIDFTNASLGPKWMRKLCILLPRAQAYRLGDAFASFMARRRELPLIKALYGNIAVVHGLPEGYPRLEDDVRQLFRNMVRGYIDLFQALERGPEAVFESCQFDPSLLEAIQSCQATGQGLVLVGAHSCSFDLLLLALTNHFPEVQALTKSDPKGSSVVMNEIREDFGIRVTPISVGALREAVTRLKSGGVVVIAADVPVDNGVEMIFFRRKTRLPVGYARLAMKTGAKMILGTSIRLSDGHYQAIGLQAHQPVTSGDREMDTIRWAQHALFLLERFIRHRPYEWFMPVPLWPTRYTREQFSRSCHPMSSLHHVPGFPMSKDDLLLGGLNIAGARRDENDHPYC